LTPSTPVYKDNKILYPSNDLFSKNSVLLIDDMEYKLDFNFLNYINDTDCDEFIYQDGKCKIIRRVGVDVDGNLYATGKEVIENKKDIELNIKHNSTIKLKSFDEVIFETTYLLKNEYTDNFATKVETKAEIKVATDEINLEVAKKVNDDEVVNAINLSTEEIKLKGNRLVVEADNFKLTATGDMTCNSGNIGGWIVQETGLTNGKLFIRSDGYSTIYTASDIFILKAIMLGKDWAEIQPNTAEFERYDLNNDGVIDSGDLLILRKMLLESEE
jgi:hypothetical protein